MRRFCFEIRKVKERRMGDERGSEVVLIESGTWQTTRRREENEVVIILIFLYNFIFFNVVIFFIFLSKEIVYVTGKYFFFLCPFFFLEWRRGVPSSRHVQSAPLPPLSLWCYLWGLRQRDDLSNAELFSTRFFPFSLLLVFSFSVSDRVWKSKFLFPFSFSSRESFS